MQVNRDIEAQVTQLCQWYGEEPAAARPSESQWTRALSGPMDRSITLINLFKFRDEAAYPESGSDVDATISGQEAFSRYAAVSMPVMERIGGKFLLVGPAEGTFLGEDEDWDLVAIGSYPDRDALLNLYSDADYRAAFKHRTAACARQKVVMCGP